MIVYTKTQINKIIKSNQLIIKWGIDFHTTKKQKSYRRIGFYRKSSNLHSFLKEQIFKDLTREFNGSNVIDIEFKLSYSEEGMYDCLEIKIPL
jgi:hypothetical protein